MWSIELDVCWLLLVLPLELYNWIRANKMYARASAGIIFNFYDIDFFHNNSLLFEVDCALIPCVFLNYQWPCNFFFICRSGFRLMPIMIIDGNTTQYELTMTRIKTHIVNLSNAATIIIVVLILFIPEYQQTRNECTKNMYRNRAWSKFI